MRAVVMLVPILASLAGAFAQTRSFTDDQAAYLQEMSAFLTDADKKEAKPFIESELTPAWNGGYFSAQQRSRIVALSNVMLKKRFVAFPDFKEFLSVLAAFSRQGRSAAEFDAWMKGLEKAGKATRKQDLADLLEMSAGLFADGTIYSSPSTVWKSSSNKFTWAYDSVPKVVFGTMDLRCLSKGDSSVIRGTSGTYLPVSETWEGKGGTLTWERAGLKPTATFAKWDHAYSLKVKTAGVKVDSVHFTDPYFDHALLGTVVDKLRANVTEKNANYPQFQGYDLRSTIRDIMPGVDFEGGFTMQGAQLQGYGTKEDPASLIFYRDKQPFIITKGLLYTIEPDKVSSEDVGVVVRLDQDSIYHPSVSLRFLRGKKQLTLIKGDEGLSRGPFYDTYHKLDMYFEELRWKQGDPVVDIGNLQGSTQTRTSFESFNYFQQARYMAMMGIDAVHPLARLRDYSKKVGDDFDAEGFAKFTRLQMTQVTNMLIDMANKGFVDYDVDEGRVHVTPRLMQHILSSAGRTDYDVLQFNSNSPDGVNGTINLLNNDLALKGVSTIILSDSQDVKIYPAEKLVTIKKDRDFTFSGVIKAGKLTYFGKEYYFHYEPFTIDLLNVDSVAFLADSFKPDENGRRRLVHVKNVLENVTGSLEIDAPGNKSGLQQKKYPEYPKFNSTKDSYVYYDRGNIQKGAYKRDKFYYRSDPFSIDSLDNFTNEGLHFDGTLMSAGIFPEIREPLGLEPDYALGFVHATGTGGLPLYGTKSNFNNTITLDNEGLHGDGELSYLTTTASSKDLVFTPDTTFGVVDTLNNTLSASAAMNVPAVRSAKTFVRLEPAANTLTASTIDKPMSMYGGQAFFHGSTELTPTGMQGTGLADFTNATLRAKLFDLKSMQVHSDTSEFRLTEGDTTAGIAFRTDNVNATIKLDERYGDFVSNGTETKVEFPINQYVCFMDRFKWYMDQGDIELESDQKAAAGNADLNLSGSNFISVRPDQDSLSFMAPQARYDLKRHLITASNVQYIRVADALITPDSMRVRIGKNAEMQPLTHATVTANFVNKYHVIHDATVNIAARRQYSGNGLYDYVDETGKAFVVHMQNINVDTAYQTYARGRITQDEGFQLSPAFDYFGDVVMHASTKELTFSGSTRIQHACPGIARNWMNFTGPIDPKEVFIPVSDSLLDAEGLPIGAGVYLTKEDPFKTYGTFLSRKEDKDDRTIISAKGLLFFDKKSNTYLISNKDKIRKRDMPGDIVGLATNSCIISADGHIHEGMDLGQVQADAYGSLLYMSDSAKAGQHVTLYLDFPFLDNALDKMTEDIIAYPDAKQVDLSKTPYERSLREILGKEQSDKLISELSIKGEIKHLPDELVKALMLCDVSLSWNGADEAWQSHGPIGLGNVQKKPVYRYLKGEVEFQRKRSGDVMTVLLMLDDQTYWFFQYARNYLYTYSSSKEFNAMISDLKEDKRKVSGKKDMPDYQFILTNKQKVDQFRDRFGL
jgi:hypothetical protein